MRNIFLVRHCEPDYPDRASRCFSDTDLPLSSRGKIRAEALARAISAPGGTFCSPMRRAADTARAISQTPIMTGGLREIGVGEWEGMSFDEIRERWPDIYARRGLDPFGVVPPGGEAPADCLARAIASLTDISRTDGGDICAVSHAGLIRLVACSLTGRDMRDFLGIKIPFGSVTVIRCSSNGLTLSPKEVGLDPSALRSKT